MEYVGCGVERGLLCLEMCRQCDVGWRGNCCHGMCGQ